MKTVMRIMCCAVAVAKTAMVSHRDGAADPLGMTFKRIEPGQFTQGVQMR